MAEIERDFDLIDHRSIAVDIDLGGTARMFELSRRLRSCLVARVADGYGHAAMVAQLSDKESLFEVTYDYGAKSTYDRSGSLQRLAVPVAAFFNNLDGETLAALDPQLLDAVGSMLVTETEIFMDIDMRDGLAEKDGLGWVQLVCDPDGMERVDSGVGGFEIGPGIAMEEPHSVLLTDLNGDELGRVFARVEVREGGLLYVALGDGELMIAAEYRLKVDSAGVANIGTPVGALRFLVSLRP